MLRLRLCVLASFAVFPLLSHAQASIGTSDEDRVHLHESAEWLDIASHLPDPQTSSAADLETAADVLRARRFPEDALDYYGFALARGGQISTLLNKMGVVRMELGQFSVARQLFLRVTHEDKRNAVAWNNLGATEFMAKRYQQALEDYHRATSLDKKNAVFHANLGLAYFETSDMDDMRLQFADAIALNPEIMAAHETGGDAAHLLAASDYPRLCFEMARLYARHGNLPEMRQWLAKASEAGYDVPTEMRMDVLLNGYLKDPEVIMILHNSDSLRKRNVASTAARRDGALAAQPPSTLPATPVDTAPGNKLL